MSTAVVLSSASALRDEIYQHLDAASSAEFSLAQRWMLLGLLLFQFKRAECWRDLGYTTFDIFLEEVVGKYRRRRTSLYGYMSVAEHLLPTISAEKLEEMGIAKALELKRAMKKLDGKPLPQALIDKALENGVTTKELHGEISKALNSGPDTKGTWFDLDGFFMDADERKEFKEIWHVAEGLLELKKEIPDHIRRKEVILTCMREWYGTHAAEFYGTDKGVQTCVAPFINPVKLSAVPEVPNYEEEDRIAADRHAS